MDGLLSWVAFTYSARVIYMYFVQGIRVLHLKSDVLLCLYAAVFFGLTALLNHAPRLILLGFVQGYLIVAPRKHGSIQSALREIAGATVLAAFIWIATYVCA